ncbi:MAG: hypothetical protein ACRD3B_07800 [Candidatus Sulfotelmatobacter sp.]
MPLQDVRATAGLDLLRRFTATPHSLDLRLMGRTIRLETNNPALLDLALECFRRQQHGEPRAPEFRWRIVCESDPRAQTTDVLLSAFSDSGIRYVSFGQRGFLAVDIENREAVGFLSDAYLKDEPRFRHRPPLDILLSLTCASLNLVTLSGGCVGDGDRGVMVFGPPNSGKTTVCYLAARQGFQFHADQLVFLDAEAGILRAWGDPFPAFFREDAATWLPELMDSARLSTYGDLSFYYFDKTRFQPQLTNPITPACSLFLDRSGAGEPQLAKLTPEDSLLRLRNTLFTIEDTRFDGQIEKAIAELARKPAYSLMYKDDPNIAAAFIRRLMR